MTSDGQKTLLNKLVPMTSFLNNFSAAAHLAHGPHTSTQNNTPKHQTKHGVFTDASRSRNVAIIFARLRMSADECVRFVVSRGGTGVIKDEVMRQDMFEVLVNMLPTKEEREICNSLPYSDEELDSVGQFYRKLIKFPDLLPRTKMLVAMGEAQEKLDRVISPIRHDTTLTVS